MLFSHSVTIYMLNYLQNAVKITNTMNRLSVSSLLICAILFFGSCESIKLSSTTTQPINQSNTLVDAEAQEELRKKLIEKRLEAAREKARVAAAEHRAATNQPTQIVVENTNPQTATASINDVPTKTEMATKEPTPKAEATTTVNEDVTDNRKVMAERLAQARLKARQAAAEAKTKLENKEEIVQITETEVKPTEVVEIKPAPEVIVAEETTKSKTTSTKRVPLTQLLRKRKQLKKADTPTEEIIVSTEEVNQTTSQPIVQAEPTMMPAPEATIADTRKPVTKLPSSSEESLYKYYFPIDDLKEAKAYRYVLDARFERDTSYRLMKTLNYNGKTVLITEIYDKNLEIKTIIKEFVNVDGGYVENYTSYEVGGFGEINRVNCGVDIPENIKWNMEEGENVTLALNYHSSLYPNYDIRMKRSRALLAKDSEIESHGGEKVKVVVFEDQEETTFTNHKDVLENKISLKYINHYAEGKGLIEYHVKENLKPVNVYKLDEVMSFQEWSTLSKQKKSIKSN